MQNYHISFDLDPFKGVGPFIKEASFTSLEASFTNFEASFNLAQPFADLDIRGDIIRGIIVKVVNTLKN